MVAICRVTIRTSLQMGLLDPKMLRSHALRVSRGSAYLCDGSSVCYICELAQRLRRPTDEGLHMLFLQTVIATDEMLQWFRAFPREPDRQHRRPSTGWPMTAALRAGAKSSS